MIWQLVKRDPGWRNALICAAFSAIACPIVPREFLTMFGVLVALCCLQSQPNERATLFQAGLPIRVRHLFLARIVALFAGVWLPVTGGAAVLLLAGRPAQDAGMLVEIGAGLSVLVLAVQSSRVGEISGSEWAYVWVGIGWAASALIAYSVPRAVVLAVSSLLCPLLFWNIWRQLPATFEVLPAKLTRQVPNVGRAVEPAFVWWPILRSLFPLRTLIFLPTLVFMPLSGQWLWISLFCFMPVLGVLGNLPWAFGLPVRRGALLAGAVLPWLTLLLSGVLGSKWFAPKPSIRLERSAPDKISEIRPPLEFWRTGEAPVIEAPWGESCRPATVHLLGVAIYNPYSLGPANSARFFEWQFRRATEVVYGHAIDYADYKNPHARFRPLLRQGRLAILNLSACACWVMLLFSFAFTAMHWRFRRVFAQGHTVMGWLVMAPMACIYVVDWLPRIQLPEPVSISLVNALLLRVSALLPATLPAVALAAVLPVVLLCWTAARLFRGVELPQAHADAAKS
jgi:hypothetical protein